MKAVTALLFQFRLPIVLITLGFILYTNIFMWFYTPFTYYEYGWRPDSQAIVYTVLESSPVVELLEVGDRILSVNDHPVQRTKLVYPLPAQSFYDLTIQRDTEILQVSVPTSPQPNSLGIGHRLPAGIISIAGWLMGALILWFAQRDNRQAIQAGSIFLLAGATIVGIQGALFGIPGTWFVGQPLVFFLAVGWLYLGTMPRSEPLTGRTRQIFKWLFMLATVLAIMAVFEGMFLFPRLTSFQEIIGISIYSLGLLIAALSLIIAVAIMVARAFGMPKKSYQRQQVHILIVFMAIGVLPAVVLTIIPRVLFDTVFLPFPLAISLLGFIPAGYFYVIYRRGLLGLDIIFSQTAVFMILALLMLAVYGTGLFVLQSRFDFDHKAITPATLLFLPMLLFTLYVSDPIQRSIQGIFFGEVIHNQSIPLFASALSSNPETTTLQNMVEHLAEDLQVRQAVLVLKNRYGRFAPVAQINTAVSRQIQQLETFLQPLLRSVHQDTNPNHLFQIHAWAEILVPIVVRGDQIGYLALARPNLDGYYNLEQVTFLSRVADMIAVGSEAINLFEASRKLSLDLLSSREDERREIASRIHDGPMQGLILVTQHIRDIVHGFALDPNLSGELTGKVTHLQDVIISLREICAGLYPPFIEQGVKFIAETLTQKFSEEHALKIKLTTPILDDVMVSAKVLRVLYHVLLESLTNIVKHAQTQEVCIQLDYSDDEIFLSVADQGVGCSLTRYSVSELIRGWHIGVVGMFEWAESVNGSLSIQQNEPHGTKVILQVPLPQ